MTPYTLSFLLLLSIWAFAETRTIVRKHHRKNGKPVSLVGKWGKHGKA